MSHWSRFDASQLQGPVQTNHTKKKIPPSKLLRPQVGQAQVEVQRTVRRQHRVMRVESDEWSGKREPKGIFLFTIINIPDEIQSFSNFTFLCSFLIL